MGGEAIQLYLVMSWLSSCYNLRSHVLNSATDGISPLYLQDQKGLFYCLQKTVSPLLPNFLKLIFNSFSFHKCLCNIQKWFSFGNTDMWMFGLGLGISNHLRICCISNTCHDSIHQRVFSLIYHMPVVLHYWQWESIDTECSLTMDQSALRISLFTIFSSIKKYIGIERKRLHLFDQQYTL